MNFENILMKFKHSNSNLAFELKNSKLYGCIFSDLLATNNHNNQQKWQMQQLIHLKQRFNLVDIMFTRILQWKSKTRVTSCKLEVQVYELRVQIYKLCVPIYELRVSIHDYKFKFSSNRDQINELHVQGKLGN